MPELPEVETVCRGLKPVMDGKRLIRVVLNRPDLRWPLPDRFADRLTGARIEGMTRRAKYILAALDSGETLILHLGMSGRFVIEQAGQNDVPGVFHQAVKRNGAHDHVIFETDAGARIIYHDPRRFGAMDLCASDALDGYPAFARLGPEPMSDAFSVAGFAAKAAGRRTNIKAFLLDQANVAGLGNIYVCEALHMAHVAPTRAPDSLSPKEQAELVQAIRQVLARAIAAGGSTLRDFAHADGELGYFQHQFLVYDREAEPCQTPSCAGIIMRLVQSGRSSFYCPTCQH